MRILFVLTFFLSLFFNLSSQDNDLYRMMKDRNEFYFSFYFDLHGLDKISNLISIDKIENNRVVAYANNEEYNDFLTLGIEAKLLLPPSMFENHNMYDGQTRLEYEWNEYPTYEAYEAMMNEYANSYSDKCSLIELATLESGRKLLIIRINNGQQDCKPKVLLSSTIHGDETVGFVLMLRLIDELLVNDTSPEVVNIRENVDLFICPNANPDGTYYAGNHTVTGATRFNSSGVDMNRNYPDCMAGAHPDGKDYAVETDAFMSLADKYQFTMSANYHGGAEVVNYPWDNSNKSHVDEDWWQMVSRQYADFAHCENPDYMIDRDNGVTKGADWYMVNGSRQDYMNYYKQCREMTIECSSSKCPPASELPLYWRYNRNSILSFLNQALCGIHGFVKDSENHQPLKASVKILNYDDRYSVVETQLPNGDFYRPIKAGVYTLEIKAKGYAPKLETIAVADNERCVLDVTLDRIASSFEDYDCSDVEIVTNPYENNVVYIKTEETSQEIRWELVSIQGQIVKKSCDYNNVTEVNLCELDSGVYFLKVIVGDKKTGKKIVVR